MSGLTDLAGAAGAWTGTNGFRLMPGDDLAERPAAADVAMGARGNLATLTYRWEHPADGDQEGLLVIGLVGEESGLTALWADSWHQQPTSMSLTGGVQAGAPVELEGSYGDGWRWRITVDATVTGNLDLRMDNVIPDSQATDEIAAGPYPVMVMQLRRAI